ncbi:hypothetical protein SAMN04487913_10245 [Arthrobacter sp. ok362]|nr:hypothetical protein SAMN04487913_10245 [Arthrobacter sp. ok362]
MFSKSGLKPEWLAWLQNAVEEISNGLTKLEPGKAEDLPNFDPMKPIFADVQRVQGASGEKVLIMSQGDPRFEFVDE